MLCNFLGVAGLAGIFVYVSWKYNTFVTSGLV